MADELSLYQFRDDDLIQLTDGREPLSLEENRDGWQLRESIPATREAVEKVSAKSASSVLEEIERQGYCQLNRFEINADWRRRRTKQGKSE